MITEQQNAPGFSVADQNNETVNLTDFAGSKNVVLYFYPKDDTPGCTIEANQFPVNESDTVKVDLQEINDEKIVLYIGEQGKIIVGYHVLMESLDKFIKANDLTDDKSLKKANLVKERLSP